MDDSQARFAAMLAGFMSDVKAPEPAPASETQSTVPARSPSPPKVGKAPAASHPTPATRPPAESVAEISLNEDVDDPEDRVVDPDDDMYRQSVSKNAAPSHYGGGYQAPDRNSDADSELPAALRKAKLNAKPSISESETHTVESAYISPAATHHAPPPPAHTRTSPSPPRSVSPPPKPVSSHPPLSSHSPPSPTHSASSPTSASSSSTENHTAGDVGTAVPTGPVYKTIMVNGPNGEKREMKIIAINPGKPLLTSENISSKPTAGGYGGGSKGWVDDDETTKCMRCPNEFSLANRRHHCRACGFVVCGTCSNHTEVLNGSDERHRVCFHCFFEIAKTGKRPYPIDRPGENGGGIGDMFAFSKKERD